MNKEQARALVSETLQRRFDKGRFRNFTLNLLNRLDESKAHEWAAADVKEAFKPHVRGYERIGTYTSPDKEKVDVLVVNLTVEAKLTRARTALRNFVADHLKVSDNRDAALVAFVSPTEKQWRFSYVTLEYSAFSDEKGRAGVHTRLTPARRSSYIVGEGESCHTAQSRFLDLLRDTENSPGLSALEEAFSVEAVTTEFFEQYKTLFLDLKDELDRVARGDKKVDREFTERKIDTDSLAKKLLGQIVFLYFLQKKGWLGVPEKGAWGDGPHNFLRLLFSGHFRSYKNLFNEVLEPLFYDTLATDRGHAAWCEVLKCRVPFLNGGLFEPLGDYDWDKVDIAIANTVFSNTVTTKAGDTGTGILDVFDRYNFTVNEAEPLEKEVAIDPEMLGKVFENLLEIKERKSKGSFYTPRAIVHYMCQESLVNYLDTALNAEQETAPRRDIEALIHAGDQASYYEAARVEGVSYQRKLAKAIQDNARALDDKLAAVRVCDPAIGSGAFPVGMMHEIVRARMALTPYFNDTHERTAYHFKRHAIQACLYGVDIDSGAVEIAKLRLWLSLVVDEDDVRQIKPLPNLDYKIVTGNSLLGVEKSLFTDKALGRLEELKPRYFDATDHTEKERIKHDIDSLILGLTNGEALFDYEIVFSEVFHHNSGFDVIIGNPPYVRVQKLSHELIDLYKHTWSTAWKRIDISTLFFELAMRISRPDGVTVLISSNQFLATEYGRKTREFFLGSAGFVKMLDMADLPVFKNSLTYVSVFVMKPRVAKTFEYARVKTLPLALEALKWDSIRVADLGGAPWVLGASSEIRLVKKLVTENPRLDAFAKCWAGVFSGLDDVLLLEDDDPRVAEIDRQMLLPVLRAQSCERYGLASTTKRVIYPYTEEAGKTLLMPEGELKRRFPKTYSYLSRHKKVLAARQDSRTTLGAKGMWYGLVRFGRQSMFAREKIVTPGEVKRNKFAIDKTGAAFSCARVFAITSETPKLPLLFLLGLLNSRVVEFFLHKTAPLKQGGFYSYNASVLGAIPIRMPPDRQGTGSQLQRLVERLVAARDRGAAADVTGLERQVDELVYALYGLNKAEVAIVEAATGDLG